MPMTCRGVRSPNDYDAVPTDIDKFNFTLGFGMDTAWGLEWEMDKVDGGSLPAELSIDLAFCGTQLADGGCSIRTTTAYTPDNFMPWYGTSNFDRVFGWTRTDMGSYVRIAATPSQCLCFQGAFSSFQMGIGLVDRDYYGTITYRVRQTTGAWPTNYPPPDGGPITNCPTLLVDGGGRGCELP